MKLLRLTGMIASFGAAAAWAFATPAIAQSTPPVSSDKARPALDPNQRICEDITVVGSRLGKKRICATRAEWAEKRKQDKETVDDAQRSANVGCNTINTHSGAPAC